MPPTAATVAGPEPEIAAKNIHVMIEAIAKPPVMFFTNELAKFTKRCEIPPLPMMSPARMKNGTAIIGKESTEVIKVLTRKSTLKVPVEIMVSSVAIPNEIAMGTEAITSSAKVANKINTDMITSYFAVLMSSVVDTIC